MKELGAGAASADAKILIAEMAKALEAGDVAKVAKLAGKESLDPQTLSRLKELTSSALKFRPDGIREMGELELNKRSRWVLELEGKEPGRDRIFLDLRQENKKWMIDKISLPPAAGEALAQSNSPDSLDVADTFLQALMKQNFEFARTLVDPSSISDAKIAGLCILFEEGEYQLRKTKPLRFMFERKNTINYLANLETRDSKQNAQFAINLKKPEGASKWIVSEINLDQLLADYARRIAGGDIYYAPLVKNPAGGDTIALYFEFDEDEINPRTQRQLEIVTKILRSDPGKKITLSGHADAMGTDEYNNSLSSRRADVIRDHLAKAGVSSAQIITIAKGASQPRRPNATETGADHPEGRRANRRTEI
ncbi:MAG: OmpA family protein [Akkermansiaceae bacterium]|nr:OmpA family protein [Akkermansiaceae bacterium]